MSLFNELCSIYGSVNEFSGFLLLYIARGNASPFICLTCSHLTAPIRDLPNEEKLFTGG